MTELKIKVEGAEEVKKAFMQFPIRVSKYLWRAGSESAKEILGTTGLQKYPPLSDANLPPTPYYVRGRGTQYKSRNTGSSQRYGTQFFVNQKGYKTVIGNRATYAPYLGGEEQVKWAKEVGWRKLIDVAREKIGKITKIYEAWIKKLLKDLNLV